MKRLALLTIAIGLATAANLWGGEQRLSPSHGSANGTPAVPLQAKSAAQWYIDNLDPVVGLMDEQKKAIIEVIESRDKTMREFQGKHAGELSAASKAIGEAYQKNDKNAIAKAQKAYQEAYAPFHQAMKESQKKLDDILTSEQREKQAAHQAATWLKALTDPIKLSEEQKQKARTIFRELQSSSTREQWSKQSKLIAKILTPEQRAALNRHRLGSYVKMMFSRIKLTDEQNKKVEALLDKTCKDPNLTLDWKTYQGVSQKVQELLTDEQKETLKKPLQSWNRAGGGFAGMGAATTAPGAMVAVPGAMLGQNRQYWLGLAAEPLGAELRKKLELSADQGLVVQVVAPESPAAKAGIKPRDVILTAGDRTLKSVQDLVRAVEQAKGKDLVLQIIRDGKKQKITVKLAKRPAEGVLVFQVEDGAKGEKFAPGTKVRRLPGGGLEVIIGEGAESGEGRITTAPQAPCKDLDKARASALAGVGQRIKRQHELIEKAWQAYQKMQSLGENKKGEAHELQEQIERLEGQLRQTFEPAGGGWRAAPWGQSAPSAQANFGERRQDAAIQELRAQVQQLRRDVEELKAQAKNR